MDPENITKVVGIIDWQSTELAPLFEHARQLCFLDDEGPSAKGLERPRLPDNLTPLKPAVQEKIKALYLKQSRSVFYKTILDMQNPLLYRAMTFQETSSFDLLLLARNLLVDGEATYLAEVADLEIIWVDLLGVCAHGKTPFPFQFCNEQRAEIGADVNGPFRGMEAMREVKESMGELFPENEGWFTMINIKKVEMRCGRSGSKYSKHMRAAGTRKKFGERAGHFGD